MVKTQLGMHKKILARKRMKRDWEKGRSSGVTKENALLVARGVCVQMAVTGCSSVVETIPIITYR